MSSDYCMLNGVKTYAFNSKDELIDYIKDKKKMLIAINAEKILHAESTLSEIIFDNIGYPDGIGAVWALKHRGFKKAIKIPGCELWLDIIKSYYKQKSIYLVGSTSEVINQTVYKLRKDFPGINILNYRDGYFNSEEEKKNLIKDLIIKKPDIVFVAAGSPFQELLMKRMLKAHAALYMGLGGSFDVYTGLLKRAPEIWLKLNLEWLYRLLLQPSRIRRQIHLVRFAFLTTLGKI